MAKELHKIFVGIRLEFFAPEPVIQGVPFKGIKG
jgi:hypothetical protein